LVATCGGFTGECDYPSQDYTKTIQITFHKIITVEDGTRTFEMGYKILDKKMKGGQLELTLRSDNGDRFLILVDDDNLDLERGDIWEIYERL